MAEAEILQYGAMGVLLVVLISVLTGVKLLFDREYKLRCEAQQFQQQQWQSSYEFIQQLATKALASQDEQIKAWRALVESLAASEAGILTGVEKLSVEHDDLKQVVRGLTTRLEK